MTMDDDMDPAVWQRRRRTRKFLIGGAMAAGLVAALGAAFYSLYVERRGPHTISPPAGIAAPANSSAGYPNPFLRMTRAGIDALNENGLCKALCRTNLECAAFRHPDWKRDPLAGALTMCDATCGIGGVVGDPLDPAEDRMARDCLKKLDCDLFLECAFPGSSTAPPASASTPPLAPAKE